MIITDFSCEHINKTVDFFSFISYYTQTHQKGATDTTIIWNMRVVQKLIRQNCKNCYKFSNQEIPFSPQK